MKYPIPALFLLMLASCSGSENIPAKNEYPVKPVPFTAVQVTDNFWSHRIETNHRVTIPIALQKSRETGRIDNFRIAGGLQEGSFCTIFPFDDSDVYKIIEGAAYSIQMFPDPWLEASVDSLITLIGLAQEEDGYLYTNRTIMKERSHFWAGSKRWEKVDDLSHELYNLGHFYEAATAWFQATGKHEIMDIALRSADLVAKDFGYGKIENWPGHQEVEIGLVKLYRTTGDKKYLDLAKFFLDIRGRGTGTPKSYNQSHIPVVEQFEALGHSVRAAYMWSGMADVAALTGDTGYVNAISRIWEDVVHRKLYITGGIGAEGGHEGFGGPYELPNERAYCETCAAIANVYWNHRMFLMSGDSRYVDVLERSLYNNVLSGVSLSGDLFFYPNPLESNGQHARSEWFGCACCPSNISRFIPSMPNYIYAQSGKMIYINLYVPSRTGFEVGGDSLDISQSGEMPWGGKTEITIEPTSPVRATLNLRIPAWAANIPFPGDLYEYQTATEKEVVIRINEKPVSYKTEKGYAMLTRRWKHGDHIEIELPFGVRKITAHPEIEDNRGKVALQQGPLVYCAEFADNDSIPLSKLLLGKDAAVTSSWNGDLLGGIHMLSLETLRYGESVEDQQATPFILKMIPYYAWAHRGKGEMRVWMASEKEALKLNPPAGKM